MRVREGCNYRMTKFAVTCISVWVSFAAWLLLVRPLFVGGYTVAIVLLLAVAPALLSSIVAVVLARFSVGANGGRLVAFRLFSPLAGAAAWFLSLTCVVNAMTAVAVSLGIADAVNNAAQFFYAHDGHFFVVLCAFALLDAFFGHVGVLR